MKSKLPEYLLCEDPTTEKENLFIYHTASRSLIHIIHTDILTNNGVDLHYFNRRHFDYSYKNNQGKLENILFVAEIVDAIDNTEQTILKNCAHWYACYLGWEDDCDDVLKQKSM